MNKRYTTKELIGGTVPSSSEINSLRVNEWIDKGRFSYNICWPYLDPPLTGGEVVDVEVELLDSGCHVLGTFTTLRDLERILSRYKTNGECANGTYLPLSDGNMLALRDITNVAIEKTIEDLLSIGTLADYFSIKED